MNNRLESRKMRGWMAAAVLLSVGMIAPVWAQSQNMIRSVTASQQANGEVVRVELSQPLTAQPSGFVIQAPPREIGRAHV